MSVITFSLQGYLYCDLRFPIHVNYDYPTRSWRDAYTDKIVYLPWKNDTLQVSPKEVELTRDGQQIVFL